MPIASGAQHGIAYGLETTFGTAALAAAMKTLRHTGSTLVPDKDSMTSEELRTDRQIVDVRHGNKRPRGDISFELAYGAQDDLIEAALGGTWATNVLKAGTTARSFTFERRFTDIAQYIRFLGSVVNTMALEFRPGRMVTGTFGIIAADHSRATTQIGAPAAAAAAAPFDTFTGTLTEGGGAIATVTALNLTLDNNVDPAYVLLSNKARQMITGRSNLTGRMSVWFEDGAIIDKFLGESETSLVLDLDGPGGDLEINIPRLKYTGTGITMNGDQGITLDFPFQALRDATLGTNIQITRTP